MLCFDYHMKILMVRTLKNPVEVIHTRIFRQLDTVFSDISHILFGFCKVLGTRKTLFELNVLLQKYLDMNQSSYVYKV